MRHGLIALITIGLVCSSGSAQSPGSIESELKYAREYLDAGSWDYAMWGYEAVLRRDPDNAEAQEGYAKAKGEYEAKKARQEAQARAFATPTRKASGSSSAASQPRSGSKTGGQLKPASLARAKCDELYGTCHAIYKSVATCAPRRAMCYTQNGIK